MKIVRFIAVLAIFCISGCSTPGSKYASAHPELSPAHRQILASGKAPSGSAIEGMTKQQVQLALGRPATIETAGQQDVWTYVRETIAGNASSNLYNSASGFGSTGNLMLHSGSQQTTIEKTKVFFQGDRANLTEVSAERQQ